MNELIRCINCDEIFLKTPFDQWPEYELQPEGDGSIASFRILEKDDFQDFLKDHQGHRLEDLKVLEDSFISEKEYGEPVKASYFKATNGKDKFVVKKFREKIDEPLKYQLIYGDYSIRCIAVEIQSKEIEKQLKAEFRTSSITKDNIDAFLKLYQYIAKNIDIKKLERISEESSNPLEIYYKMDSITWVSLLRNCRNIFKGQEYLDIEEFIKHHKDDGVLLLKATHKIQITERAKSEKRAVSARIPLRMRRVAGKG
jgi:hypothetical protein